MSREIKYRVWAKKRKGYRELDQLVFGKQGLEEVWVFPKDDETQLVYHPSEVVAEQYTGLTDKNGKEIYEGDIIHFVKDGNAKVLWGKGKAMFCLKWLDCGVEDELDYNVICRGPVEVIGNIHENPELLGVEE